MWFGTQVFAFKPLEIVGFREMPEEPFGEIQMLAMLSAWFVPVRPTHPWRCQFCERGFWNVSQWDHHEEVVNAYGECPNPNRDARDLMLKERPSAFLLPSKLIVVMFNNRPTDPFDILDATRRPLFVKNRTMNTELPGTGEGVRVATNRFCELVERHATQGQGVGYGFLEFIAWQGDQFWKHAAIWKEGGHRAVHGKYQVPTYGSERFSLYPECVLLPFLAPVGHMSVEFQAKFYNSRRKAAVNAVYTRTLGDVRGFPADPEGV
jgi:hypothetical protein